MSPHSTSPSRQRTASRWRKRLLTIIALGLCLVGVLLLSRRLWLPWLHDYLDVSKPPQSADFLVILGGNNSRARTAADLYKQGFAPRVIVSGCSPFIEQQSTFLEEEGIPPDAILVNDHAQNTWHEAQQVLALLQTEGATSALIITDRSHTRRARATYAHLSGDLAIDLTFVASSDAISSENWWQSEPSRRDVLIEYPKLVYYLFRYGVTPWEK
jgi:uncharacterized SAM-binding protein YcdF (DUF218 family)